jgi:hypothetical protein
MVNAVRQRAAEGESPWGPVWRFLARLSLAGDLIAPWKLFDDNDDFFWTGTYTLSPQPPPPAAPLVSYTYDSWLKTLTVTVSLAQAFPDGDPPVVGILLFYDATQDKLPLMINYVALSSDPAFSEDRKTITQTLSVPDEATKTPVRAKVMVNLAMAPQTFVIPAS